MFYSDIDSCYNLEIYITMWWGMLFRSMRGYAPYITLPFAAVVGFIGYNIENKFSSKYTPYNDSIKELRKERLLKDQVLQSAGDVGALKYNSGSVLDRNLSPSLQNP